jgi:alkanesulfonate monooxygenase SsuD/methylene tetrahydromethanopterin reductase-like flavin-dependent oxidoreductase (luciferase family)
VKFAVSHGSAVYGCDPDDLADCARHAEHCGFEAVYVPDHVALYPGARFGAVELDPTLPYFDPLDALSFVAAVTDRILLGTGVLLLPHRHPVVLAKRLATIDHLSRGRMRLRTVGLGSLPDEARAVGVDFAARGRRADEAIDVAAAAVDGRPGRRELPRRVLRLRPGVQLPETLWFAVASDPHRRVESSGGAARGSARRRLFRRRFRAAGRAGAPARHRSRRGRGGGS